MTEDDTFAVLRDQLHADTDGPDWDPEPSRRSLPDGWLTWWTWGGFLVASVTVYYATVAIWHAIIDRLRDDAEPVVRPQPPYPIVLIMATLSAVWLVTTMARYIKGGPTGASFFAIRALQERTEIATAAVLGPLPIILWLVGFALSWGPGGLLGQTLAVPYWLVGGGPRGPVILLAAKLVAVFFALVYAAHGLTVTTQTTGQSRLR